VRTPPACNRLQFVDWSKTAAPRSQPRPEEKGGDADSALTEGQKMYEAQRHALFYTDKDARWVQ